MGTSTVDQARQTAARADSASSRSRTAPVSRHLWSNRTLFIWLFLLLFLTLLSDVRAARASAAYDHAWRLFVHGNLDAAQQEADYGYRRLVDSDPDWARKFLILEASSMSQRSLYNDLLNVLADGRISWNIPDEQVQRLALQARALTKLHHFPEASLQLAEGETICAQTHASHCGYLLRARGMLFVERGDLARGKQDIEATLRMARNSGDDMLAGTALLNLAYIAAQQERHDEAVTLSREARETALKLGSKELEQRALGGEAWQQFQSGNAEKAIELFDQAEPQAVSLGNKGSEIEWLSAEAVVYRSTRQLALAERKGIRAIELARGINDQQDIIDASMELAQNYIEANKPDDADRYAEQALAMAQETGSPLDLENVHLIAGQAAALRHDWAHAEALLREVSTAADSQPSMRWEAQRTLANIREAQGDAAGADTAYRSALAVVEGARSHLEQEESRLTFLAKATRIYDEYIQFLVRQGKTAEALEAADWSRARTLQQGLGVIPAGASTSPLKFSAVEIARKSNATLLFYWLGEQQSYLWAAGPGKLVLLALPKASEIAPVIDRYRQALLDLKDPVHDGNKDGRQLYETLVAPAANLIARGGRVVILTDGPLSQMNFETFIAQSPSPHYWIEDATLLSAPSIRLFAAAKPTVRAGRKLLLLGDSISPGPDYPDLPLAALEMEKVRSHLPPADELSFSREQATPAAYLKSGPEQFSYIHFVTHGTANRVDPLDSAVILSRAAAEEDSYKLYARDILLHPIHADLVTISACNSSGNRPVAGEGLVGVSWAFLRAGAHNAIGSLWEVGDASTPQLMDRMYGELERGQQPAEALRAAKLAQIHSEDRFRKPFYWAPFQLYAGR